MRRIKTMRKPSVILYMERYNLSIYSITLVFCVVFARVSVGEKWLKYSVFTAQAALFCSAKILAISDSFFRGETIYGVNPAPTTKPISPRGRWVYISLVRTMRSGRNQHKIKAFRVSILNSCETAARYN